MLSSLIKAALDTLAAFLARLVADWRRDGSLERKGAAEAEANLNREIAHAADEQAKANDLDRGGADAVLARLQQRLDRGRIRDEG